MTGDNLTNKTFRGFFWQIGGTIFKTSVQLGVLFILARLISKSDFGIVQSALIVVGLAKLVSEMGVGPALVQKNELTELHIRTGVTLSFILSVLLFLLTSFTSGLISDFFHMPDLQKVLQVISVLFIIEGITTVSQSILLREMKQKVLVQIDFFSYLIGYGVVAIIMSYKGFGYWALIVGQICQSTLKCILSYWKSRHSLRPYYGMTEIKELLYFGGGFTIARFFNYFANQGDNIIVGRYLGASLLGVYSRAYSIMVKPVGLVGDALDKVLFPAMAARQKEANKVIKAFINSSKLITFICIPISVVIILSSKEIVSVLLGSKWMDVVIPLQILTAGLLFRMGYRMGSILTKAMGDVYKRAVCEFLYATFIIIGCYIGAGWGIIGVSYGVLISLVLNYMFMIHLSLRILKLKWFFFIVNTMKDAPIALLISLLFYVIRLCMKLIFHTDLWILISSVGLFGAISIFLFYNYSYKIEFLTVLPNKGLFKRKIK